MDVIKRVIDEVTKAKAEVTQIPLPQTPPQVVAPSLLPTNGTDDAAKIVEQHLKLLEMAAELSLSVVPFAADGAASELAAQVLMNNQSTLFPPITYDYPTYGVHLKAPGHENWSTGVTARCRTWQKNRSQSTTERLTE
ncbi:hypothetical protein B0H19DRAFT_1055690 [Mycena capillaripes]|nr:hypothetical protein B0H19DRAFT_1055690 [Mycena capillaripes]